MTTGTGDTARSTANLCFRLMNQLGVHKSNICISPLSISAALQLAVSAAGGNTLNEMLQTLNLHSFGRDELALDYRTVNDSLNETNDKSQWKGEGASVKFVLANSAWFHQGVQVHPGFAAHVQTQYAAECANLDFGNGSSIQTINNWVSQKTFGKIPSIVAQLAPSNYFVLLNCAYFKARWSTPFQENRTLPRDFYLSDGNVVQVPTMHGFREVEYFNDQYMEMVQLPYTDDRFNMYLIQPAKNIDLPSFVSQISAEHWDSWMPRLTKREGQLAFPKFRMEFGVSLMSWLSQIGIRELFTPQADLWNILAPDQQKPPFLCVSDFMHKAFIDVNELGTEAAAATCLTSAGSAHIPKPPFEMTVDRPFLFVMSDKVTNVIMFAGAVFDPRTGAPTY
jgi:serine protease inhibitor